MGGASWQHLVPSVVAPAYRIEWALTADDYRRGTVRALVLPSDTSQLKVFLPGLSRHPVPGAPPQLTLGGSREGEEGCMDTLRWPRGPDGKMVPIHVGVIPLFADGTEAPRPEPTLIPPPPEPPTKRGPSLDESIARLKVAPLTPDQQACVASVQRANAILEQYRSRISFELREEILSAARPVEFRHDLAAKERLDRLIEWTCEKHLKVRCP